MEPKFIIGAFTHWLYYAEPDFIEQAWRHDPHMRNHLREKLNGFIAREVKSYMTIEVLVKFHQELTDHTKEPLYKYIMEHHLNKW